MKNLVLAAGKASKELSVLVPPGSNKVLLRILGKPIIYYPLTSLQQVNHAETILVYRVGEEKVYREALKYSLEHLVPVAQEKGEYVHNAIESAENKLRDTDYFILVFGDLIVEKDAISQLISTHLSEEPDATVLAVPAEPRHIETYGLMVVDENNYVKKVLEKKPTNKYFEEPLYISGGVYILPTWILDYISKGYSLPGAIDYIAKNGKVKAVHWSGLWIDTGYPADLLEANYQLLSRIKGIHIADNAEVEKTAVIEGPVIIDEHAYIDHYVVIKGPAYIGKNTFIGAYSFMRFYVDVEEKTALGAYNEVRYSNLQPYVKTHSRTIILDSIIGENTVLESNITILNILPEQEEPPRLRTHIVKKPGAIERKMGAVIGYNCKISTNKILNPGQIIEPNTIL